MSDSLWPLGLQHTRLPCPSLSHRVCSNSHPLSQWCYLTISSSFAFSLSQHQGWCSLGESKYTQIFDGCFLQCLLFMPVPYSLGPFLSSFGAMEDSSCTHWPLSVGGFFQNYRSCAFSWRPSMRVGVSILKDNSATWTYYISVGPVVLNLCFLWLQPTH